MFLQHKLFLQRYLSEMLNVCIAVASGTRSDRGMTAIGGSDIQHKGET